MAMAHWVHGLMPISILLQISHNWSNARKVSNGSCQAHWACYTGQSQLFSLKLSFHYFGLKHYVSDVPLNTLECAGRRT